MKTYLYIGVFISVSAIIGLMEYRYVSLERDMSNKESEHISSINKMSNKISQIQNKLDHETALYEECKSSIGKLSTEQTVGKILEEIEDYEKIFNEDNSSSIAGSYSY